MGIQFKQIDNLQSTFDSLSGDFQGQINANDSGISNVLSGSSSIGGWKYFTGNADFSGAQGILVDPSNIYTPNNVFAGGIKIGGSIANPRTSTSAPAGSFQVTGGQSYFDDQVNIRNSAGIKISNGAITGGTGDLYYITGENLSYGSGNLTGALTVQGNPVLTGSSPFSQTNSGISSVGNTLITSGTGNFNTISFDPSAVAPSHQEGRIFYDSDNKALAVYNDEADITLQVGQEQYVRVRNNTSSAILNGQAVYINGSHGAAAPTVELAISTGESTSQVVGLATHDIETSSFGYVTTYGIVRDVNTTDFSAGDSIYLSEAVSGGLTGVAAVIPNYKVDIGHVIRSHSNGTILVQLGTPKLGGGDVKVVNGDINISGVPYYSVIGNTNAGGISSSNDFVFDSGNARLGIGTSSPEGILDMSTTISAPILPRLNNTEMDAISSPVNGMIIYNTTSGKFAGHANSSWIVLH
jgi:hypothetical protein